MVQNVLIYTQTLGFRHDSIPTASNVVAEWGNETGLWNSVWSQNSSIFTDESLAQFQAMVWISTTGQVLNGTHLTAFENWLQNGGHFASIHDATNALVNSSMFGNLTGGHFCCHPSIQNAIYDVYETNHPAVTLLPSPWEHYDEVYQFRQDPRLTNITLLLSANQSTYNTTISPQAFVDPALTPGPAPQPISWYREPGHQLSANVTHNGRLFQTGLGHANATWLNDTFFRDHIFGGINWLLGINSTNLTAPGSSYAAAAEYNATLGSSTSSGGASTSSSPTVTSDALSYSDNLGSVALLAVGLHLFKPAFRLCQSIIG